MAGMIPAAGARANFRRRNYTRSSEYEYCNFSIRTRGGAPTGNSTGMAIKSNENPVIVPDQATLSRDVERVGNVSGNSVSYPIEN
ncbi:hypothetical protein [Burkholderia stagnalis]